MAIVELRIQLPTYVCHEHEAYVMILIFFVYEPTLTTTAYLPQTFSVVSGEPLFQNLSFNWPERLCMYYTKRFFKLYSLVPSRRFTVGSSIV